jgi:hypothetical protein
MHVPSLDLLEVEWLTTHIGTHPLPRSIGQTLWDAVATPDDQAA